MSSRRHTIPHGSRTSETRVLQEIVSTVASTLDLDEVLEGGRAAALGRERRPRVLRLPRSTRRGAARAPGGVRALRASRRPDRARARRGARVVGARASGSRRSSARTRSTTRASKYVPELEEERFQSLVCVPILGTRRRPDRGRSRSHGGAARVHDRRRSSSSSRARRSSPARSRTRGSTRRRGSASRELEQLTAARGGDRRGRDARRARCRRSATRARAARRRARATSICSTPATRSCDCARREPAGRADAAAIGLAELGPELGAGRPRARGSRCRSSRATSCSALLVADGSPRARSRARGREPDGSRDQEDPGDRAAHREEPDQGLLRGARRRRTLGRPRGPGGAARLRPRRSRTSCSRRCPSTTRSSGRSRHARARLALRSPRRVAARARCRVATGGAARWSTSCGASMPDSAATRRSASRASASAPRRFAHGFEEARHAVLGAAVLRREPARARATTSSAPTSTCCGIALEGGVRDATIDAVAKLADYDRERGASLLADARGVSPPPRQHQRHRRRRSTSTRTRSASGCAGSRELTGLDLRARRLADGRDRGEDGPAPGRARYGDAAHMPPSRYGGIHPRAAA